MELVDVLSQDSSSKQPSEYWTLPITPPRNLRRSNSMPEIGSQLNGMENGISPTRRQSVVPPRQHSRIYAKKPLPPLPPPVPPPPLPPKHLARKPVGSGPNRRRQVASEAYEASPRTSVPQPRYSAVAQPGSATGARPARKVHQLTGCDIDAGDESRWRTPRTASAGWATPSSSSHSPRGSESSASMADLKAQLDESLVNMDFGGMSMSERNSSPGSRRPSHGSYAASITPPSSSHIASSHRFYGSNGRFSDVRTAGEYHKFATELAGREHKRREHQRRSEATLNQRRSDAPPIPMSERSPSYDKPLPKHRTQRMASPRPIPRLDPRPVIDPAAIGNRRAPAPPSRLATAISAPPSEPQSGWDSDSDDEAKPREFLRDVFSRKMSDSSPTQARPPSADDWYRDKDKASGKGLRLSAKGFARKWSDHKADKKRDQMRKDIRAVRGESSS